MIRARADLALALLLAAVFAWAAWTALAFPQQARLFPLTVALVALVLALLQALLSLRGGGVPAATEPHAGAAVLEEQEEEIPPRERARRGLVFVAWVAAMLAGMWLLGFVAATAALALAYSRVTGRESWPAAIVVTVVSWALVFGVFDRLLHVPLPPGELVRLLGLG